jgi:hypothetical protein
MPSAYYDAQSAICGKQKGYRAKKNGLQPAISANCNPDLPNP